MAGQQFLVGICALILLCLTCSAQAGDLEKYGQFSDDNEGFSRYCLLHELISDEFMRQINEPESYGLEREMYEINDEIHKRRSATRFCPLYNECARNILPKLDDDEFSLEDIREMVEFNEVGPKTAAKINADLEKFLPAYSECANNFYARLNSGELEASEFPEVFFSD